MVKTKYIPNRGDIVWLNFNPAMGHEQAGKRPALVVSPEKYNEKSGLALVCPITSNKKGYPFEVEFSCAEIGGVILADHIKSIDWKARKAKFVSKVGFSVLAEVQMKISLLLN